LEKRKPGRDWPNPFLIVLLYVPLLPAAITLSVVLHGPLATAIEDAMEDSSIPLLPGLAVYLLAIHLIAFGHFLQLLEVREAPQLPGKQSA
jgi:hypothetical protein